MTADLDVMGSARGAEPALTQLRPLRIPTRPGAVAVAAAAACVLTSAIGAGGGAALPYWAYVQLTMGALGALVVGIVAFRSAVPGADRSFHAAILAASVLWVLVQASWFLNGARPGTVPDGFTLALAVLVVAAIARSWHVLLSGRLTAAEQVAAYLDIGTVSLIVATAVLLVTGGAVSAHPAQDGLLLFGVVLGGALAGLVALYLAIGPVRPLRHSLTVIGGLALLSGALLLRGSSPAVGWHPATLGVSLGMLLTSYGCARWRVDAQPTGRSTMLVARVRSALPVVAVASAAIVLVLNELTVADRSAALNLAVDVSVAGVLILSVLRQTLLLGERDRMVEVATEAVYRERDLVTDLQKSEQRFRTLIQNSSDVVLVITLEGEVLYQSPAVERVLGYDPQPVAAQRIYDWMHAEDAPVIERALRDLSAHPGATHTMELRARHADGSWRTLEATGTNLLDDPVIGGIVVNYRDITDRRQLESQLMHEAFHDPLTGLPNRALFTDRVEQSLRRRGKGQQVAVLFMDLDDFKTINDSLGHAAGDQVLVAVAERLEGCLRPEDTVSRLGGDEFAVLVEEDGKTLAAVLAERIIASLRRPFGVGGKQVQLGASIGIARGAGGPARAHELLRNADVAMYTAKSAGKSRVAEFESRMHAAVLSRLETKAALERALPARELRLHYQPVFRLDGGGLAGFEALLRWRHPQRGEIGPAEFVALAEETGLIVPIGRWVLEQACRQGSAWNRSSGEDMTIGVNISARQLREPDFVETVRQALDGSGLEPERLMVELTETSLMQDDEGRLGELRALGVRLALDDFGTGYSSLSYLARFPIGTLKIDRSFISRLGEDEDDAALVRSVVQLAGAMNMETVAEGIERPEQLEHVKQLGCDFAQGFLFARPMNAIRATRMVGRGANLEEFGGDAQEVIA